MLYSLEFFQLQVRFARKLCELEPETLLAHTLTRDTTLAGICQLRSEPDQVNATWQQWLNEALAQTDPAQHLHQRYRNTQLSAKPETHLFFGCFSYNYPWQGEPTLRLHFANRLRAQNDHPLAADQLPERRQELRALVDHARNKYPDIETIRGGSWLYNLPVYRAIFPKVFLDTAFSTPPKLKFMSTWGQFVDHAGNLREPQSTEFADALQKCGSRADCEKIFPLPRIEAECDFARFCKELL